MPWRRTTSCTCSGCVQSSGSKGLASLTAGAIGTRMSLAITEAAPCCWRSAATNSEPICPAAPVTRIAVTTLALRDVRGPQADLAGGVGQVLPGVGVDGDSPLQPLLARFALGVAGDHHL